MLAPGSMEKECEQIVRTPFSVGRGFISRRFIIQYHLFPAAGKACFMESTPSRSSLVEGK